MQVAVTHPARGHVHQDLAGAGRRDLDLADLELLFGLE
jgi:hypothetical protein